MRPLNCKVKDWTVESGRRKAFSASSRPNLVMIHFARPNSQLLVANFDLHKFVEKSQDTELRLVTGKKVVVKATVEAAKGLVVSFREVGFYERSIAAMRESSRGAVDPLAGVLSSR